MTRRIIVFLLLLATAAFAQSPTPEQFLGYKLGDRFTQWPRIVEYFDALAKSSSLITVQQFGETYEHRPLILAVITSPKNRAQLEAVRANVVSLANGSVSAERAAEIAKSNPAVAWLAFGVHGNESSSAEAAMAVASTLVNDPASASMLDTLVVVIDPLLNPDGRERYIQWFVRTRGTEPNPNPDAFEHTEPWPGGRFNHYLIDMNRDWAWSSQRETRARIAAYRRWMPQVFVDFHEMFYNSTYFFPPDAKPINANLPKDVNRWLEVFGRANAEAFTRNHWPFFVGETFDLFYPGYGDSWPSLHGAIGMTYEVAGHSRAGTSVLRDDGNVYTLADRIARHTTSGLTTLRTAAAHREELLRYSYEAARTQLAAAETTYFLAPAAPGFQALVDALQRQGVDIGTLSAPVTVKATRVDSGKEDGRTFPAGTAVVSTRQALGGLVQTALERIGRDETVAFVPVETGWIGGTAFGSERIHFIKDPKIALVGGNGTDSTSYGMLWHTLDVDTPIPHTTLSMDALRNTDFGHY